MSRREDRDSRGKRLHSRFDRSPSPKRSRDGRRVTEGAYSNRGKLGIMDQNHQTYPDQKHAQRLQDALHEASLVPESKTRADLVNKEVEKADDVSASTKPLSEPTDVPRSRSYFQHDERGIAGQGGRSFGRRATGHGMRRRWTDPKDRWTNAEEKPGGLDTEERDDKVSDTQRKAKNHAQSYDDDDDDDDDVWRHDRYREVDPAAPTSRRRPAFRENKVPAEEHNPSATEAAPADPVRSERPIHGPDRREERGYQQRGQENSERAFAGTDNRNGRGDGFFLRCGEMRRAGYPPSGERFGPGGGVRGRERYDGRSRDRNQYPVVVSNQVEKWKHDLFDEANRSPTPKNEEDQIAEIEALLAL